LTKSAKGCCRELLGNLNCGVLAGKMHNYVLLCTSTCCFTEYQIYINPLSMFVLNSKFITIPFYILFERGRLIPCRYVICTLY
jgi:hypothetical protein